MEKKVYVWPGYGYYLEKLDLSNYEENVICLDELCYKCLINGLGDITPYGPLTSEEVEEYENNEIYVLCDISMYDDDKEFSENMYFMNIENLKAINIEIC